MNYLKRFNESLNTESTKDIESMISNLEFINNYVTDEKDWKGEEFNINDILTIIKEIRSSSSEEIKEYYISCSTNQPMSHEDNFVVDFIDKYGDYSVFSSNPT